MMNDARPRHDEHAARNNPLEPCNELDLLAHSESAQIQEFRLYRELSREIGRSAGTDRLRYADSELCSRGQHADGAGNKHPSPAGGPSAAPAPARTSPARARGQAARNSPARSGGQPADEQAGASLHEPAPARNGAGEHEHDDKRRLFAGANCQVCRIKELRDDLSHVTKIIQERNEQLSSKLKARRLRTFFERQMLE